MDWSKGFSARYYASFIDPVTWRDIERFEITGGNITRSGDSLIESADIDCVGYDQPDERWIRIWLDARQGDEAEHVALFTGIATSPDAEHDGNLRSDSIACYSVLKAAEDVLLSRGWYAPAGASTEDLMRQLLKVTPAPVEIDTGSPELTFSIIAEDNESNLSMLHKILTAINWRVRIDGDGTIRISQKAKSASAVFGAFENDSIEPKITLSYDWYKCPNVFRAVCGDLVGIARDDSPNSRFSTVSRGREVWMEDSSCKLNDGETVADYALRRLKEEQQVLLTASYNRRYHPDIRVSDMVELRYSGHGLAGTFEVISQSIDLGYAASTKEGVKSI